MNKSLFTALFLSAVCLFPTFAAGEDIVLDRIIVEFRGVGSPRSARDALDLKKGMIVTRKDLEESFDRLASDGHYASLNYEMRPGRGGHIDLLVDIEVDPGYRPESGEMVRVDSVEISGNWKTHRRVFLSELTFSEGEPVDLATLEESIQRIFNRELFFEIDWGLYDEGGKTIMEIRVREKWTLFPVIYVIGDDGQTRLMLGAVELNTLGRGFMLLGNYIATFSPDADTRHNFEGTYRHRRIAGTPFAVEVSAGYITYSNYISDTSGRVDAYTRDSAYIETETGYEWNGDWCASLLLGYAHDQYDNHEAIAGGYAGYSMSADIPSFGVALEFDGVDLRDVRRQGGMAGGSVKILTPVSSSFPAFFRVEGEAGYHEVFLKDYLNVSARLSGQYSSSEPIPYRSTMESLLRGGSGREYHYSLVFGGNIELGFAPIRHNWLFLEILGFADIAWGGDGFSDAASVSPRYRAGPGFRLTVPPVAGTTVSMDLVWTEEGESELFFGMVRFF